MLGRNELTMFDVEMFPLMERSILWREIMMPDVYENANWSNLEAWFANMNALEWVRQTRQPEHRHNNYIRKKLSKELIPLTLPLTFYDNP